MLMLAAAHKRADNHEIETTRLSRPPSSINRAAKFHKTSLFVARLRTDQSFMRMRLVILDNPDSVATW